MLPKEAAFRLVYGRPVPSHPVDLLSRQQVQHLRDARDLIQNPGEGHNVIMYSADAASQTMPLEPTLTFKFAFIDSIPERLLCKFSCARRVSEIRICSHRKSGLVLVEEEGSDGDDAPAAARVPLPREQRVVPLGVAVRVDSRDVAHDACAREGETNR